MRKPTMFDALITVAILGIVLALCASCASQPANQPVRAPAIPQQPMCVCHAEGHMGPDGAYLGRTVRHSNCTSAQLDACIELP